MLYAIEGLTLLFAIFCAFLNEVPVLKMMNFGASLSEEKKFHRSNALVKLTYSLAVSLLLPCFILTFLLTLLIQWVVFDIALNLLIGHPWDYTGRTAVLDKWLGGLLDDDAGKYKAGVCALLIILLNLISI